MTPGDESIRGKGPFKLGMIQKLVLVNVLVFLVFGMVVLAVLFSFRKMEGLSKDLIDNNINQVIANAQLGRDLQKVLGDTDLLVGTFQYGKVAVLKEGGRIVAVAERLEAKPPIPEMKGNLHQLTGQLFSLFHACALVKDYSEKLELREKKLFNGLDSLEQILAEKMVSRVLEGKDATILEQLSIIIPGYRETLLQISLEHVKLGLDRNEKELAAQGKRLVWLLDDLFLRLRTITASDSKIASSGVQLMDDVSAYKKETMLLLAAVSSLEEQLKFLDTVKKNLLADMKAIDAQVSLGSAGALRDVTSATGSSRNFIVAIFVFVLMLLGGVTFSFILVNIRRPMRLICQGINSIRQGDLETRIHLDRHDEWSVIERALNEMVADLQTSYEELQGINGELIEARSELQDKVSELEAEIGERERAESKLKNSEKKWHSLYENLPGGSFTVNKDYIIEDVNDILCSMTGFSREELVGQKCGIICPKGPHKCPIFDLGRKRIENDETAVKAKDGKLVPIIKSACRISMDDQEVIVENFQDITDRKLLEEQLQHARKMEAVGQLAGGVAHDFNNILTAIIGYGTLLRMQLPADDPARAKVDQILGAAERAADLTRSLLTLSRKQVVELQPVCLNSCAAGMQGLLASLVPEDIEFLTEIADEGLTVMGDNSQLEQVLMNLVSNARDSIPDGGRITLRLERRDIDHAFYGNHTFAAPGRHVVITVSDTGIGMDEQTRERIFEPFYTTKAMGKGTGLGLAIVYGIIQQHNGHIDVVSELGKGSTFRIYLKEIEAMLPVKPVVEEAEILGGVETVLLGEDEQSVRDLVRSMLEEFGYMVLLADNGAEAVRVFRENRDRIDLLLFDVIMPKMNGKEAYNEIRKLDPSIPALFMSGYTGDILNNKGVREEGLNFLTKPVTPRELLSKMRAVLDA
ncbi:MAG: ATP-binding protein [Geobacteraceae bacterium]|nr:ATP-binding protein [Geobacteraceae bacterium]